MLSGTRWAQVRTSLTSICDVLNMGMVKVEEGTQMHCEVKKFSFGQDRNRSEPGRGWNPGNQILIGTER